MGVSWNGGTQQPWVFLLKIIILGCFGDTTFKETPICLGGSTKKNENWSLKMDFLQGAIMLPTQTIRF